MKIYMRSVGFALTDAITEYVREKAEKALRPLAEMAPHLTVRLEDENADRGGIDKRCKAVLKLQNKRTVVVEARSTDLYAAIEKAAHRLRRATISMLKRRERRERMDSQRPGTFGEPLYIRKGEGYFPSELVRDE